MKTILQFFVRLYRLVLSPILGPSCRFQPTCSAYAHDALEKHGALKGAWLTLARIFKCHPLHKGPFYDPVPPSKNIPKNADKMRD